VPAIHVADPTRRQVMSLAAGGAVAALLPLQARAGTLPEVVRIGYLTAPRAWVIGKTDGSFDKALGTKVEWVPFPAGGAALSLLAAKQIDFAVFGDTPIIAGLARKLPIQILGSPEIVATSERLIAKPGIDSRKALEGKRVAVAPHGWESRLTSFTGVGGRGADIRDSSWRVCDGS
jgi:taurine transport system substrate-binding protein